MKASTKYQILASQEENDLKALRHTYRSYREKKMEHFEEMYEELKSEYIIEERDNGSFTFHLKDLGKVDLYPKSNKALIRKQNKWVTNGLAFILKRKSQ
jgi:hypothetical protein